MNDNNGASRRITKGEVFGSFAMFCLLSVVVTWPQLIEAARTGYSPDLMLNEWALRWDLHAIFTRPMGLFDANILYPARNTLALSDHMLGILPLWLLFYLPSGNAHAALNWMGIFIYALTGWGAYLLARYWTGSVWGALAAGIVAGFHSIKMYHYNILPLLSYEWFPLILLAFTLFFDTGMRKWLLVAALLYAVQLMSGFYNGYAVSLSTGLFLLIAWALNRRLRKPAYILGPIIAILIGIAVNVPLAIPYLSQEQTATIHNVSEGEDQFLPHLPGDMLKTTPGNKIYGQLLGMGDALTPQPLFPGIAFPLLMAAGLISLVRRRRGGADSNKGLTSGWNPLWLLGIPGVLLALVSLGAHPVIFGHRINSPMPYTVLAWVVPGFHNVRAPQRFSYSALALGAMFVAYGVAWFSGSRKSARGRNAVGVLCAGVLLAECWMAPFKLNLAPNFAKEPAVYQWLHDNDVSGGVLELPFDDKDHFLGALYNLMSLIHLKPIANGYNGYYPSTYMRFVKAVEKLPDEDALRYLDLADVHTIIEHKDLRTWIIQPYDGALLHEPAVTPARPLEEAQGRGLDVLTRMGADTVWRVNMPPVQTVSTGTLKINLLFRGPVGEDVIIMEVVGDSGSVWKNPRPWEGMNARLIWHRIGQGVAGEQDVSVPLPMAAVGGPLGEIHVRASFPGSFGTYELEVKTSDSRVRGTIQTVTIVGENRGQ